MQRNPADASVPSKPLSRYAVLLLLVITTVVLSVLSAESGDQASRNAERTAIASYLDPSLNMQNEDVVIAEVATRNRNGLRDFDGDTSDWIELWNRGEETIQLENWTLSDDVRRWDRWRFPAISLAPDARLVVFASGKESSDSGSELHTNFSLDGDGEFLGLFTPDGRSQGANLFYPSLPALVDGVSLARIESVPAKITPPSAIGYFSPPSPGRASSPEARVSGICSPVEFSKTRGYFDRPFRLKLRTATRGASIRITLDGSTPGVTTGNTYRGGIRIDESTVVRAVAVREGWVNSTVQTHTYIFPSTVIDQKQPSDYPQTWGEGLPAHYTLSSETADAFPGDATLESALTALPTISVATSPRHLFDADSGIYVNTERDGVEWERPVSIEFFGMKDERDFQIDAGLRIQGRSSRKPATSPKHSFRVLFKGHYGPARLQHPLYGSSVSEFNTLVLRATSNNSWTFPLAEQRRRAQYVRDSWAKDSQRSMGHESPRTRYVHLYLNGLYWGLYAVSERPDAAFMATHIGGEEGDYDVRKGGEIVDGSDRAWSTLMTLAARDIQSEETWQTIQAYLNVDNFIDYMILNHYAGNENWDYGNWYAARSRADGGFQFFAWDMESILGRIGENKVFVRNRDRPTELFHRLRKSDRFLERFAERAALHLTGDGALTPARAAERFLRRSREIETAILAESARWGDYRMTKHPYRTGPFERYTRERHWYAERKRMVEEVFPQRTGIVLEQYRRAGLLQ